MPIPTPKTMVKAPPAPKPEPIEEPVEEVEEEVFDEEEPIEEEPEIVYHPEAFIKASLNAAHSIKEFLGFVETTHKSEDIKALDECVECYYDFESYNFGLEAKQIFFLNLAKDLKEYMNSENVDRENA